ncbi:hypothetical protein C0W44_20620, partial [Photobacterium leiognathi subsp. mandapamensis]
WIDANANGDFEVTEYASAACNDTSSFADGSAALSWTGLTLVTADSYMRFRISDTALTDADGLGSDDRAYGIVMNGEVEDHLIQILHPDDMDGGDAPDSYLVEFAEGGPKHIQSSTLYLGADDVDGEASTASDLANLDDTTGADELGISLPDLLLGETSYTATAKVFNNTGADATLVAWLDHNQNGTFEASEAQLQTVPSNNTLTDYPITWSGLSPIGYGVYNLRFRLAPASDGLTTASVGGIATNGEVEDHQLSVLECSQGTGNEWGIYDQVGAGGTTFPGTFQGVGFTVTSEIAPNLVTANGNIWNYPNYFLHPTTDDAAEYTPRFEYAGTHTVTFDQPMTNLIMNLYSFGAGTTRPTMTFDTDVRVIYSPDTLQHSPRVIQAAEFPRGGSGANGTILIEGTVQSFSFDVDIPEYWWTINFSAGDCKIAQPKDIGDAPDMTSGIAVQDYQTLLSNQGAAHILADTDADTQVDITLGTAWDEETQYWNTATVMQNLTANADDVNNIDDEDGVTFPANWTPGESVNVDVTLTKDPDTTLNGLQVYAWVDWNLDGDWDDAGEQIINNATAAEGINTAAITVPAGASLGYSYVRVRACSTDTSCNSPIGEA